MTNWSDGERRADGNKGEDPQERSYNRCFFLLRFLFYSTRPLVSSFNDVWTSIGLRSRKSDFITYTFENRDDAGIPIETDSGIE